VSTSVDNAGDATQLRPGEQLRAAREQRGLTPVQAAHEMRIDLATLRALESDDYARLGAPIFVKGHLRNYAKHLGLAADPLVAAYEQIAAPRPPSLVGYRNEGEQMGGHLEIRRWLPVVAGGIATVLLVLFALWLFRRPDAPPVATTAVVPAPTAAPATAPPAAAPASAPAAVPASVAAATVATVAAAAGNAPRVEAPADPERAAPPGQVRVSLRFSGESWVEVKGADGQFIVYQLFEAGQTRNLTAAPPLLVYLGQAAAVTLTIDGRKVDLEPMTKRDATARFTVAANGSVR
jgi:cytoskeleton protein RodZ